MDGNIEETAKQLKLFNEPRAILENKPFRAIPNKMGGVFCRGATFNEIKHVLDEAHCGFCLDIGHAICSANSQKIDKWQFIEKLNELKPKVYHLTDLEDINSEYDSHAHFREDSTVIKKVISKIPNNCMVTIETGKASEYNLVDFVKDVGKLCKLRS